MNYEEIDAKTVVDYSKIKPFFVDEPELFNEFIQQVEKDILDQTKQSPQLATEAHYEYLALQRVVGKFKDILFAHEKLTHNSQS